MLLKTFQLTGADCPIFLQNTLTADITLLAKNRWTIAAYCSAQGKVIAIFWVIRTENDYFFALDTSIADELVKRLQIFTLNRDIHINTRNDLNLATNTQNEKTATLKNKTIYLGGIADLNHIHLIQAGIPNITANTQEKFLPQMLNLDTLGALSYEKGCYIGQEVIARARYKAPVRRHLYRIHSPSQISIKSGETLYADTYKAATVIQTAQYNGQTIALAVIQDRFTTSPLTSSQQHTFLIENN